MSDYIYKEHFFALVQLLVSCSMYTAISLAQFNVHLILLKLGHVYSIIRRREVGRTRSQQIDHVTMSNHVAQTSAFRVGHMNRLVSIGEQRPSFLGACRLDSKLVKHFLIQIA